MNSESSYAKPITLLLGAFLALSFVYMWATPLFEASDELWHFGMVQTIAETGELPVQDPAIETAWEQEGSQPPLYYLIAAGIVQPFDLSDIDDLRQPNPHTKAGLPLATDNKNLVLHDTPHTAPTGSALAVYAVRLFSIMLGVITVSAVYASGRVLAPKQPHIALLAAALTAFNPMFLFITASVNNDNLVIALGSVIVWQTLVMLRDGLSLRRSALLALLLALASLTKISGNVFVPVVALAGLYTAWKTKTLPGLIALAALMIGAWLSIAGWWYLRNIELYGELFGTSMMVAVAGARDEPLTLRTLLAEFQGFRISYWGLFGGVNILVGNLFYWLMDAVVLLAGTGLVWHLWQKRDDRAALINIATLGLLVVLGIAGVIQWTLQTYASQGRLLFPFIAAISSLLALGLGSIITLIGPYIRRPDHLVGSITAAFGVFAFIVPLAYITPAYEQPISVSRLPDNANPVHVDFGPEGSTDAITLIGYETIDQRYEPGSTVPIVLYWQVNAQSSEDYSLYVHAVDDAGNVIGKVDTYPGSGTQRTTTWTPGTIYVDRYDIPIDEDAAGRSALRLSVGWWHYPSGTIIQPHDENTNVLESVMLQAGGFVNPTTTVDAPLDLIVVDNATFDGVIRLQGFTIDDDQLTLLWESTGTADANYTVFVQVLDAEGSIVGQGDAPPGLPTGYWRRGEQYTSNHQLVYSEALPTGSYDVLIGWYAPTDFARLRTQRDDNAYLLTTLDIP